MGSIATARNGAGLGAPKIKIVPDGQDAEKAVVDAGLKSLDHCKLGTATRRRHMC